MKVQYDCYLGIDQFLVFPEEAVMELSDPVFGVKQSTKQDNKKPNSNTKNESKPKSSSFAATAETPEVKTTKPDPPTQSSGSAQKTGTSSAAASTQMTGASSASTSFPRREIKCVQCDGPHPVYMCDHFKSMTPQQRLQLVNNKKCCYNCLKIARHKPDVRLSTNTAGAYL